MIIDHQSAWVVLPATSRSGTGGLLHKIIQRSPPLCTHCTQPLERRTAGLPVYTSKCICEPLHFPDSPQFERREVRWKVGSIICFSFSCCTVACVDSRTTHALTHSLFYRLKSSLPLLQMKFIATVLAAVLATVSVSASTFNETVGSSTCGSNCPGE